MYKVSVALIFGVLLLGLSGCATDPKDKAITDVLSLIDEVTSTYSALKTDLNRSIEKHKKAGTKLGMEDWKPLVIKAEELKKIAEKTQAYKGYLDTFRENTTDAQKKTFEKNYGDKFRTNVTELDREERLLDAAVIEAERMTDAEGGGLGVAEEFKKKLKDGRDVFELLTKQR